MKCDNKEQKLEMVSMIKEKSFEKMGLLTVGEFADIAHKVLD